MGRHRRRAQEVQAERAAHDAAELRSQARRWWIRALFAAVAGAAISFLTVAVAVVLGLIAVWAIVRGFRLALEAQRLDDAAGPG